MRRHPILSTILFLALLLTLSGCDDSGSSTPFLVANNGTGSGSGQAGAGATGGSNKAPSSALPSGAWYSGDLHSHSSPYSPDAKKQMGDPVDVCIRLAEVQGLDFWALTDHRTIDGTKDPDFHSSQTVLLPGMEWGGGQHANTIGIHRLPPKLDKGRPASTWNTQVQAIIDDVHAQGGIFSINHPTDYGAPWFYDVKDFDAIEIWNTFWAFRQNIRIDMQQVNDDAAPIIAAGGKPAPAIVHAAKQNVHKREQAVAFWEWYLNQDVRVPAVGGGDRHMLVMPGYPTTWVHAPSRDRKGILDGIRAGRTYISSTPEGPRLEFTADTDGDGAPDAMIGDEVPKRQSVQFTVTVRDAVAGRIEIVKNGAVHAAFDYQSAPATYRFTDVPKAGDWWRVDVYERIDTSIPGGQSLLNVALNPNVSNPNFKDLGFYLGLLDLLVVVPQLQTDLSNGTLIPTIMWTREQVRILNADIQNPTRCRSVISSPIYTER